MEHSLGVNTFQLIKKFVDKVIPVRYFTAFVNVNCFSTVLMFPCSLSEEDSLVAMLRFQEFERTTVDTEAAMGLAAILAGALPELRGKRYSYF